MYQLHAWTASSSLNGFHLVFKIDSGPGFPTLIAHPIIVAMSHSVLGFDRTELVYDCERKVVHSYEVF